MDNHVWLTHFPKITYARHKKLAAHFLNGRSFSQLEFDDFCSVGLEPEIAHEIITWREKNPWEKIKKQIDDAEVKTISIDEPGYPSLLKQITDPPWSLFVRGQLPQNSNQPSVGVVGTRRNTLYGKEACIKLSEEMARHEIVVVSGLALGIDSFAHQSVLNQDGLTIAVLGCGIDRPTIYPRSHENLSEKIIKSGGALVSEYPPGTQPTTYSFPARNRIIAGLTQGTLVIEAPVQSGALITARRALDYNREVMAVPHPISSINGAGGNELIKKGAALIASIDDICEVLNWQNMVPKQKTSQSVNTEQSGLFKFFSHEAQQLETIIQESGLPSDKVLVELTLMEMRGVIRNLGGGYYVKNS